MSHSTKGVMLLLGMLLASTTADHHDLEGDLGSGSGSGEPSSGSGETPRNFNTKVVFSMTSSSAASYFNDTLQTSLKEAMATHLEVDASSDVRLIVAALSATRRRLQANAGQSLLSWQIATAGSSDASKIAAAVTGTNSTQWNSLFKTAGVASAGVTAVSSPTIDTTSGGGGGGGDNSVALGLGLGLGLGVPLLALVGFAFYKKRQQSRFGDSSLSEGVLRLGQE